MVVRIRAELETGETLVGPIMGNGGMVGSGALCSGRELANAQALNALRIAKDRAAENDHLPIFEPTPGCVALYPDYCGESDGERVNVPLAGTQFSIA